MRWLRALLLVGCLGAVALSAATAPWKSRLVQGNHSWIIHLGRHPVWLPPPDPDYLAFRQKFDRSADFPPADGPWVIRTNFDAAEAGLAALAYCWLVALVCGLLYLAVRGPRRDVVLHCALHVSAGLSAAAAACIALWCVIGSWGPPAEGSFAVLGVVGGMVSGLVSFQRGTATLRRTAALSPHSAP